MSPCYRQESVLNFVLSCESLRKLTRKAAMLRAAIGFSKIITEPYLRSISVSDVHVRLLFEHIVWIVK